MAAVRSSIGIALYQGLERSAVHLRFSLRDQIEGQLHAPNTGSLLRTASMR
ncbi:hypothetical protein P608_04300 [Comamonas thiooxydans]|uniref:Uncharacterized protein n=1 Tax=Comamonas thiooxydans TaxID=363952 RepID=A0A0E3C268_9BURK|nr:hypothetical protein P608_04300 [Comamonas thiooxydans]KGH27451.1 hypothetical protein P606_03995 [Comamonas thiooxydans]KGH27676.1 hypothetical protein P607_03495 [Comamonas thiooxydans]